MMELFLPLGWIACAIGAGAVASSKRRSFFGYFVLGLVFPIVGLLIAIGMAPKQPAPRARMSGYGEE